MNILIGSPVHQKPAILEWFLTSLFHLEAADLQLGFCFVDDNQDSASRQLLANFAAVVPDVEIIPSSDSVFYLCDDTTHHWNEELVWRVAAFKDAIIDRALQRGDDAVLFLDSDLVLAPKTLVRLAQCDVDIVSEVFWTRWQPDAIELPQVWLHDIYSLFPLERGRQRSGDELNAEMHAFLARLRIPGLYEVGGLGACTLISRRALAAGARFKQIPNLSFPGEDRHFCIRAAALGFLLHADTTLPPLHLYRDEDLARAPMFAERHGVGAFEGLRVDVLTVGT